MIELHSMPTPNGQKVMIMLEEIGLDWTHIDVDIRHAQQFSAEHIKLSPNNKIPALVDPDGPGGRYTMMESGAILIYLAEKTGKLLPTDPRKRYDTLQWLIFQMAHIGPMFGQSSHFNNLKLEGQQYAKDRYNNEAARLMRVLDHQLHDHAWLAGDEYTIADIAVYPWTRLHKDRGINAENSPNFIRWFTAMEARPAVQRSNAMTKEIMARMNQAAEGKQAIDIYNTKDNAERHAQATKR